MTEPQETRTEVEDESTTLSDDEMETGRIDSAPQASVDDEDTGDDSGDDSGDVGDPTDTGDDTGDDSGDDSDAGA